MSYTYKVEELLYRKNPNFSFIEKEVNNGVIIKIIEKSINTRTVQGRQVNYINKLVVHISYQTCDDDGSNYIYLNFIRVENDYKNTKMSKYIMAYFVGHLIEKYGQIPIQLQNATNNTIIFNVKSCKRMKTQVKSLSTKSNIVLPRNSTLRSGKVRIDKNYWKKFGFEFKDDDPSEMEYTGKLTDLYNKMIKEINKDIGISLVGSGNQYIKTKNGRRKIHTGKKGGKYYIMNKKKIYILFNSLLITN